MKLPCQLCAVHLTDQDLLVLQADHAGTILEQFSADCPQLLAVNLAVIRARTAELEAANEPEALVSMIKDVVELLSNVVRCIDTPGALSGIAGIDDLS